MKILAIDTSCDDTSVAVTDDLKILSNIIWTKKEVYEKYGGVMPSEAKRQHLEFLPKAIEVALMEANTTIENVDYIAVTYGPGLAIALEAGISKAKELSSTYNKKLVAVNHIAGHIYAVLARDKDNNPLSIVKEFEFPIISIVISGGHSELVLIHDHYNFEIIGETLDDALGECFDKVGRMVGLNFPAGAKIEELAKTGNKTAIKLTIPMEKSNDLNFSYSGLKTSILYKIRDMCKIDESKKLQDIDAAKILGEGTVNDLLASFQNTAAKSIVIKVTDAIKQYKPKMLTVGGGVIANTYIRESLKDLAKSFDIPLYYPIPFSLCTDNGAMIAIAAYHYIKHSKTKDNIFDANDLVSLERAPSLRINDI